MPSHRNTRAFVGLHTHSASMDLRRCGAQIPAWLSKLSASRFKTSMHVCVNHHTKQSSLRPSASCGSCKKRTFSIISARKTLVNIAFSTSSQLASCDLRSRVGLSSARSTELATMHARMHRSNHGVSTRRRHQTRNWLLGRKMPRDRNFCEVGQSTTAQSPRKVQVPR